MRVLVLALLAGCSKPAPNPAPEAGEPPVEVGPAPPPKGFVRVEPPGNFKSMRPLTSAALPDGSFAVSGAAVRIVQYQWTVSVPAIGLPVQRTFDPGRIEWVRDNGTGGLDAVGVLGGVPEDKAWYGEIDAFGNLGTRQTYLSDGSGQLNALVRLDEGLVVAGELLAADAKMHGWMVRADNAGRDLWKAELGDAPGQSVVWLAARDGQMVGGGWRLGATEDPWLVVTDAEGAVQLDHSWKDPAWSRATSGRLVGDADVMLAGISAPTSDGPLNGTGSLWLARIGLDGAQVWDRSERTDLSLVTRSTPYGRGIAVAALRGPFGSDRTVLVAGVSDDGKTNWVEPKLPPGIDWAEVHSVGDKLMLIAAITDDFGISIAQIPLQGSDAP